VREITHMTPVRDLHRTVLYRKSTTAILVGSLALSYLAASVACLVTAVAFAVLKAGHKLAEHFQPDSLGKHIFVKLALSACLASISAIVLLSFGGLPLTAGSVSMLAAVLAAPSFAESVTEVLLYKLNAPEAHSIELFEATKQLYHWDSSENEEGFKRVAKLVKAGYLPAFIVLYRCHRAEMERAKNEWEKVVDISLGDRVGDVAKLLNKGASKGDPECQCQQEVLCAIRSSERSDDDDDVSPPPRVQFDAEVSRVTIPILEKYSPKAGNFAQIQLFIRYIAAEKYEEALALADIGVKRGDPEFKLLLARAYITGLKTSSKVFLIKDYHKAVALLLELAEQDNRQAINLLLKNAKLRRVDLDPSSLRTWRHQLEGYPVLNNK